MTSATHRHMGRTSWRPGNEMETFRSVLVATLDEMADALKEAAHWRDYRYLDERLSELRAMQWGADPCPDCNATGHIYDDAENDYKTCIACHGERYR